MKVKMVDLQVTLKKNWLRDYFKINQNEKKKKKSSYNL